MSNLIDRQVAIEAFKKALAVEESKNNYVTICSAISYEGAKQILENLPSAQPEPSIPLSWFDEQIERLKSLDNAFATLTAMQISGMVKKWSDEQNE